MPITTTAPTITSRMRASSASYIRRENRGTFQSIDGFSHRLAPIMFGSCPRSDTAPTTRDAARTTAGPKSTPADERAATSDPHAANGPTAAAGP